MPPCLKLIIIRYGTRVKWSNPGNGVAPSPAPRCNGYCKGSLRLPLTKVANFTFTLIYAFLISCTIGMHGKSGRNGLSMFKIYEHRKVTIIYILYLGVNNIKKKCIYLFHFSSVLFCFSVSVIKYWTSKLYG